MSRKRRKAGVHDDRRPEAKLFFEMPAEDAVNGSPVSERGSPGNSRSSEKESGLHRLDRGKFDAILFDLDGVVTETARIHAEAWKHTFDDYLKARAARLNVIFDPFDSDQDYKTYVDGKPRYDGVASFLQSRDIRLPRGEENDPPDKETVCGLGNRKNQRFLEVIRQRGVEVYPTSIEFIRRAKAHGFRVAVVTSSRNGKEVLEAAGIGDLFDARVDGVVAHELMLAGKPAPDTYLEAARRLGVQPAAAVVIEDAVSGVQAGRAGRFGLVVGVSRNGDPELLKRSGADVVVSDLGELKLGKQDRRTATTAPSAIEMLEDIRLRIRNRRVAMFLDYDGTLTPIVARPELAVMSDDMRATLKALAERCTVLVISGRARGDVKRLVGLDNLIYAGCHGFDIVGPKGTEIRHEIGRRYLPEIAQAVRELHEGLDKIEGVIVEDKAYAVATHFRMVRAEDVPRVAHVVDEVLARHPLLRKTHGKKVFELLPDVDWDKGKAVLWLLDALGLDRPDVVPFYLGDDVTDRDAFEALRGKGISILVAERPQPTCADYRLSDTAEVRAFLGELSAILGGGA